MVNPGGFEPPTARFVAEYSIDVYKRQLQKSKTALWAFGLTDEVFAAATAKLVRTNRRWSENWMSGIAFSSWSSWVFGTVIGAFSGSGLLQGYPAVEAALGFMLPALLMSCLLYTSRCV